MQSCVSLSAVRQSVKQPDRVFRHKTNRDAIADLRRLTRSGLARTFTERSDDS